MDTLNASKAKAIPKGTPVAPPPPAPHARAAGVAAVQTVALPRAVAGENYAVDFDVSVETDRGTFYQISGTSTYLNPETGQLWHR